MWANIVLCAFFFFFSRPVMLKLNTQTNKQKPLSQITHLEKTRKSQDINLIQEKYATHSVYFRNVCLFVFFLFLASLGYPLGVVYFLFDGHENISQLTCSSYSVTLSFPIRRRHLGPSRLRPGRSLCLSSSSVDMVLWDS